VAHAGEQTEILRAVNALAEPHGRGSMELLSFQRLQLLRNPLREGHSSGCAERSARAHITLIFVQYDYLLRIVGNFSFHVLFEFFAQRCE
jgi:hypothetical protein